MSQGPAERPTLTFRWAHGWNLRWLCRQGGRATESLPWALHIQWQLGLEPWPEPFPSRLHSAGHLPASRPPDAVLDLYSRASDPALSFGLGGKACAVPKPPSRPPLGLCWEFPWPPQELGGLSVSWASSAWMYNFEYLISPLIHKINKGDLSESDCELFQAVCGVWAHSAVRCPQLNPSVCLQGRRGQEADGPGVFVREVNGLGWRALNLSLENPGEASEEPGGEPGRRAAIRQQRHPLESTVDLRRPRY